MKKMELGLKAFLVLVFLAGLIGCSDITTIDTAEEASVSTSTKALVETSYTDAFSSLDSTLYTVVSGTWEVSDSVLQETSGDVGILLLADITSDTDASITASVKSQVESKDAGLLIRYEDEDNYYTLALDDGNLKLKKKVSGSWNTLGSEECDYSTSAYSEITLSITDTTLSASFEGEELISVSDSSLTSGSFGLKTSSNSAYYDDLVVTYLTDEETTTVEETDSVELTVDIATSSTDDGNTADNTLDNDTDTRWSASGEGEYITFDLATSMDVTDVMIAFYNGDSRSGIFEIWAGDSTSDLSQILDLTTSSGTTTDLESYDVTDVTARYVRIVGYGNTSNSWNSITEVEIWGTSSDDTTTDDTTAPDEVSDLSATAGDTQVTLSWTDPSDSDFALAIVTYDGNTATTEDSSLIITDLTNGTEYDFTVQTQDTTGNISTGESVSSTPVADTVTTETYPTDIIPSLSDDWKITLPVDEDGDDSSEIYLAGGSLDDRNTDPWEIALTDLIDFEYQPYFQVDDGGVRFRAHCAGATTSGSYYPRSELRQEYDGGDNYWSVDDYQYLNTRLKVTQTPVEKPEVCITQIHGPNDEPLRIQYHAEDGLYVIWNEDNKDYDNALDYTIGDIVEITVTVNTLSGVDSDEDGSDDNITCEITNETTGDTYSKTWTSADSTGYFKVGCYTQSTVWLNEYKGDDYEDEDIDAYGEVIVYSIDLIEDGTATTEEVEDDTTAPSSVTSLSATAGDSQVALSWTNPSDSDFSYVEISYGSTSVTSTGTSKTITGLTNDTSYTFSVVAYDESGNASSATTTSATPVADEEEDDSDDDSDDDDTSETVSVSSLSGLADAIEAATAGQTIVLADGTYSGEIEGITSLTGTSSNPIIIRAETIGGVSIDLSSTIAITTSSYVTIKGFNFTSDEYSMMKIINCDNISIMDNIFDEEWATDNKKTVVVNASAGISTDIEFGYNVFKNKDGQGGFITTEYDETYGISTTHHLHHNYFLNMMSEIDSETGDFEGDSDREAVCFGVSDSYNLTTNHLVEYNLFEDCDGENEIITVKTDTNVLRYNTFKNCLGSLSLRFGDNHEVYGNIFYGDDTENNEETGGIRLYGSNQKVYNNYFYNLTGETSTHRMPIVIDAGGSGDHSKVEDSFIAFNTVVDCYYGIGVGMNYSSAPINNYIGNNIVVNSTMNNIIVTEGSDTNVWEGNISYNESLTDDSSYVYSYDNPNMALSDGIYKLTSSSTNAIDSAVDSAGTYSDVTTDIDGGTRDSSKDIGADEYGVTGSLSLLTSSDVGQR